MKQSVLNDIYKLPVPDRIRLAQEILESVSAEQEGSDLTADDRAELNRRLDALEKDPKRGSRWPEVKRRLRRMKK